MTGARLKFSKDFDWRRVAWGKPNSPRRNLCAYCAGALSEVPLMLWREDGSAISLCEDCCEKYIVGTE